MSRLLVVRHGESTWNAEGRWQGQADPPLSVRGCEQAAAAAERLEDVGLAMAASSDLARASATARILADCLGIPLVGAHVALRERRAGPWQGLTRAQIEEGWPGFLVDGHRPAGYEVDTPVAARAREALMALALRTSGAVLVVTHGGLLRALERAHGIDGPRIPNLGGRWWSVAGGPAEVRQLVPGGSVRLLPDV